MSLPKATASVADSHAPPSALQNAAHVPDSQMKTNLAVKSNMQAKPTKTTPPTPARLPSSPQIRPQTAVASPSPYVLTPANARTPSRMHRSPSPLQSHTQNDVTTREATAAGTTTFDLDDLKQQIEVLSAEIEGFSAEREALKRMLVEARLQV